MIVGCYTLDLYCENDGQYPDGIHSYDEFPHTYSHENGSQCRSAARKDGWKLTQGKAICPKCTRLTKRALDASPQAVVKVESNIGSRQ